MVNFGGLLVNYRENRGRQPGEIVMLKISIMSSKNKEVLDEYFLITMLAVRFLNLKTNVNLTYFPELSLTLYTFISFPKFLLAPLEAQTLVMISRFMWTFLNLSRL